jgi:hypothetical protein
LRRAACKKDVKGKGDEYIEEALDLQSKIEKRRDSVHTFLDMRILIPIAKLLTREFALWICDARRYP